MEHIYTQEEIAKFNSKLSSSNQNGCILWNGSKMQNGYGEIFFYKRRRYAHRVCYEIHKGSIPKGMYICHKCDNRLCVNIEHLFLGTPTQNAHDMIQKNRHNWEAMIRGTREKIAKLKDYDVINVKKLLLAGISRRAIAKKYSVCKGTIDNVFYYKLTSKQRNIASQKWKDFYRPSPLTQDQVNKIRQMRKEGYKAKTIAEKFNVTSKCISAICLYKTWKELK